MSGQPFSVPSKEPAFDPALVEISLRTVKKTSPFAYYLALLFFAPGPRLVLFMAYSYFRWLDDSLDEQDLEPQIAKHLVSRQVALVSTWYAGEDFPEAENLAERELYQVIRCDRASGRLLENMIRRFLEALAWDAVRRHTSVSQSALDHYSSLLGCAYAEGLLYGLGLNPIDPRYARAAYLGGVAAHLAHILRDFELDLSVGYYNISLEDQHRFGIDLSHLNLARLCAWKQHLANRAYIKFCEAKRADRELPTRRARLLFYLVCARYRRIAEKVRSISINQGEEYRLDNTSLKNG